MSVRSSKSRTASQSVFYMVDTSNNLFTWGKNDKGGAVPSGSGNYPAGLKPFVKDAIISYQNYTTYINTWGEIAVIAGWGNNRTGSKVFTPPTPNTGFEKLYEVGNGFIAKKADNTFYASGDQFLQSVAANFLTAINQKKALFFDIASNSWGAALLFNDGVVISVGGSQLNKGHSGYGSITGISQIFASASDFAGLKSNGTITFWGNEIDAGNAENATNIAKVYSSSNGFVVITNDNKLYSKGKTGYYGGFGFDNNIILGVKLDDDYPTVAFNSESIDGSLTEKGGFGYITTDGKLGFKGDIAIYLSANNISSDISNCMAIYSTSRAYAIVHTDKRTITLFGHSDYGGSRGTLNYIINKGWGDNSPATFSTDIKKVFSTGKSFIFLKDDDTSNDTYSILLIYGSINYYKDSNDSYYEDLGQLPSNVNTGIVDVVTTYDGVVFIKEDGTLFFLMLGINGLTTAQTGWTSTRWQQYYMDGYNPSKNIGAISGDNRNNLWWGRNTLSRSKNIVDVSNAIITSSTFFSSKDLTDYFSGNAINVNSATDTEVEGFLTGIYNTTNTTNITTNLALKLINLLPAKSSVIINKLFTLLNTASQTLTLSNVLTVAEKTIFDTTKIVDISGGNTTPTTVDKEIFKGLKELSFRKLRQDLKGTSLETKIKDISENDVNSNIETFLSNINTNLSLNLTDMDLSGLDLTNTDLSGATLVNTDFSGTILSGANLHGVDLSGANLEYVNFQSVNLTNAIIKDNDLSGINLQNSNLTNVNFKNTNLQNSNLISATIKNNNFNNAKLMNVSLINADLSGIDLKDANLTNSILTGANLQGTDVSGANLSNVDFNFADFTNLQNFAKTIGIAKNIPYTHQYYLNQPFDSTENLSKGSYVASTDTIGPFKDGESIAINGIQITFGNSISEAGLLGINNNADGGAFAFMKNDNKLEGWGNAYKGADIPTDISNVKAIFSTKNAKAVICNDGKVISWGISGEGGNAPTDLSGVIDIQGNEKAFVGLYHNGDIVCWGDSSTGGTRPIDISNVIQLYSNKNAFAAIQSDGSIKSWGLLTGTAPTTTNFIDIYSTNKAFAALDSSGNVSCWGSSDIRENTPPTDLSNVSMIHGNDDAFAALIVDGTVKCWGNTVNGGTTPTDISNVDYISNTNTAFTAITNDGEAICWGNTTNGGTKPTTYIYTDDEEETVDITVAADANGTFDFSGYTDSSANLFFINNETQKEAGININKDFYFFNTKNQYDDIVYISNKEFNNATDHTFIFKTLKDSWCLNTDGNAYIKIGFIYTSGGKDYTSYRHGNIFTQDDCPHYYINNPAWIKTEEKTLTLKLLSNKMTLQGHDGATIYEDTDVSLNSSNYKLAISIYNGIIKLENTFDVSYPTLKCGVRYKFDQSDSSNAGNTLKFSAYDISGELIEDSTTCYGTPGTASAYTLLHNTDIERAELYPYSVEKGLDAGKKHKKIYFEIETIIVTVVSGKFVFNGNTGLTPDISHNIYYKFDVSHSSNLNHPLSFSKDNNTTEHNVNRNGASGSAGAYVTFKNNDPNNTNIYVFCKMHGVGMGSHYNPITISRIKKTLSVSNVNKVFSTKTAFSALKNDETIVAWGDNGGNYTENIQTYDNLTNKSNYDISDYVKITNTGIFLITKSGGFWTSNYDSYFGPTHATHGLKNHKISDIMSGIKKIIINNNAICVLKNNNSVITWGYSEYDKIFSYGGNSSNLKTFLSSNIKDIVKTDSAFCALRFDGKIETWGHSNYGGNYTHKYDEITDISSITSNKFSMAAISNTGKLYTWGKYGRYHNNNWSILSSTQTDSSTYESDVETGITDIFYNLYSGIATKDDGNGFKKVCAYWGSSAAGRDPSHSTNGIRNHSGTIDLDLLNSNIKEIFVHENTFFILKDDNKLYGWGGLMNTSIINNTKLATLTDISSIHFTENACAALKTNGEVITWGTNTNGGDKADGTYGVRNTSGNIESSLLNSGSGVVSITSNFVSFCALKSNGTVLCWGNQNQGGNPYNTTVGYGMVKDMATSDMHSFVKITNSMSNKKFYSLEASKYGFAGLRSDGAIIIWGLNTEVKGSITATELKNSRDFVDIKCGDERGVFVGIKSDGSVALFGSSHRSNWYRGNNYYAPWNANYKEGHVHLPGTMRAPDIQMTNSIKKLTETSVIEKNKFKNISATDKAFAAIKDTGDIVVWGDDSYGGKQTDLSGHIDFTHIFSNRGSFVGLKEDQTMHNWGNASFGSLGGPSVDITISPNLQEINQFTEPYRKTNILTEFGINADTKKINDYSLTSNAESNALINIDGSIDTWGNTAFGGLTTDISNNLKNVKEIITGGGVMTVLKANGTTTTWKNNAIYETNKPVNLNNVKKIVSGSDGMVVALKADGTVVAWHSASNTWDLSGNVVSNDLSNLNGIVDIFASNKCFVALKYDNSLYIWGSNEDSTNRIINNFSSQVSKLTSGVKEVYVNGKVLIALKFDGTVVTIGNSNNGGDISNNDSQYKLYGGTATDIADVFLNDKFAIGLKKDNSCVYWGDISRNSTLFNNDISTFTNIKNIIYSKDVMIGIKFDGKIVGLGEKIKGAEPPQLKEAISKVYATTNNGFSLLKTNGEVISWGDSAYGGEIA
jgi:uncharacterized protein YjbI with pentapeptide repeats/alpha-tubulin suppressor-like RCC1 family protein